MRNLLCSIALCVFCAASAAADEPRLIFVTGVSLVGPPTGNASTAPVINTASSGDIAAGVSLGQQVGGSGGGLAGGMAALALGIFVKSAAEPGDIAVMAYPHAFLFLPCAGKQHTLKGKNIHVVVRPYRWYKLRETEGGEEEILPVPMEERATVKNHECFAEFSRLWGINVGKKAPGADPEDIF